MSFLRQACQNVYHQRGGGEHTTDTLDNEGEEIQVRVELLKRDCGRRDINNIIIRYCSSW